MRKHNFNNKQGGSSFMNFDLENDPMLRLDLDSSEERLKEMENEILQKKKQLNFRTNEKRQPRGNRVSNRN